MLFGNLGAVALVPEQLKSLGLALPSRPLAGP